MEKTPKTPKKKHGTPKVKDSKYYDDLIQKNNANNEGVDLNGPLLKSKRELTWLLMNKCGECGGGDLWKHYDASEGRYHVTCNNIPRAVLKILENEKPKTQKKRERKKKDNNALVQTLSGLNDAGIQFVTAGSPKVNAKSESQGVTDSTSKSPRMNSTPSKRKGSNESNEKMTPAKKLKLMQDIKFCGFSISF